MTARWLTEERILEHQAKHGRTVDLGSGGEEKRGKGRKQRQRAPDNPTEPILGSLPTDSRRQRQMYEDAIDGVVGLVAEFIAKDASKRSGRGKRAPGAGKAAIRAPEPSEHASQVAVIQFWASYCRTKGLDERLLFCIPNASRLTDGGRVYKWAEGLRPGVPDLMLALPMVGNERPIFAGLFIEMKRRGDKPTEAQARYHTLLRTMGYNVVVAIGAEEAITAIKAYVERAGGIVKSGALRDLTKDLTKDFPNPYAAGIRRV